VHLGADATLVTERSKRTRDRRLLHLRLRENPNDAVAYCYLALMAERDGRRMAAKIFAQRALDCGPRTLHDDRVTQLQRMLEAKRSS
jgi:outer membrane PBP1 activator LpoA protein